MANSSELPDDSDTFELTRSDIIVFGLICVAVGVALGFFLPVIGSLAARFPIPFGDAIEKLSQFDQAWVVVLRPVVGAVLGVVTATAVYFSTPRLTIGENEIVIDTHNDQPLRISRKSFSTAYFDSSKLTILTEGGHAAFKGSVEGKKDRIATAFESRGYRWGEI